MPNTTRERLGLAVGATLIAEGVLVAILRFLVVVYVVASEAYSADRFRTPLPDFLPWVASTVAVTFVLVWAGSFLRRSPEGAWAAVGAAARADLVAAFLLNGIAFVWAGVGLARSASTVEALLAWIALGTASLLVMVGLVRDGLRRAAG